jgi:hypothetical protein
MTEIASALTLGLAITLGPPANMGIDVMDIRKAIVGHEPDLPLVKFRN